MSPCTTVAAVAAREGVTAAQVPADLVTQSGSGLDPHLPPEAIRYQLARVAAARNLPVQTLEQLLEKHTEQPLVGPPVVNVLLLNQALAQLKN